jgi:hypothetical protein
MDALSVRGAIKGGPNFLSKRLLLLRGGIPTNICGTCRWRPRYCCRAWLYLFWPRGLSCVASRHRGAGERASAATVCSLANVVRSIKKPPRRYGGSGGAPWRSLVVRTSKTRSWTIRSGLCGFFCFSHSRYLRRSLTSTRAERSRFRAKGLWSLFEGGFLLFLLRRDSAKREDKKYIVVADETTAPI